MTFPFLNSIETSSQTDLLVQLPALYKDLNDKKVDTLNKFVVSIHGMSTPTLSNDLSKKIIDKMCISAAAAVKLQCGREYGFSDGDKLRATDLSSLTEVELVGLPTNNLVNERDLYRFDREA